MRGVLKVDTGTSAEAAESCAQTLAPRQKPKWIVAAALAAVALVTVAVYSSVLSNFFNGDDFVHLQWLREAVKHPELIWRNFHSSWLDGTTTKFYRPLISVFMVSDYLVWGTNGFGFHITNLLFHLAGSAILYLIVREFGRKHGEPELTAPYNNAWAIAACAVFALYPLHPEAVSWITGRVDSVVTTFCLAQLWLYMRWRASGGRKWLALSLGAFVLGLLSKEMAITIPGVICAYELFFYATRRNFIKPFLATTPFWAVVVAYFGVRRLALGTFVGGYDDSLLFIADKKAFVMGWLHALRMFVEPINKDFLGSHSIITKAWEVFLAGSVASAVIAFVRGRDRNAVLFTLAWLACCLAPVYKIFSIADDLQGSRLAYLATAPLAILFGYALSNVRLWRKGAVSTGGGETPPLQSDAPTPLQSGETPLESCVDVATVFSITTFSALCALLLWTNNQAWHSAGEASNAIRASLKEIYAHQSGDPQTLLLGIPDQIHGAYVSRNALAGMTEAPQLGHDVRNAMLMNSFEPIQPFGFLKDSIAANADQIKVYRWSSPEQKLRRVDVSAANAPADLSHFQPIIAVPTIINIAGNKRPELTIDTSKLPTWKVDFVQVKLNLTKVGRAETGADLLYANAISPEFQLGKRTHADVTRTTGEQTLLFSLHSLPEWAFGGSPSKLKLLLPAGASGTVESVTFPAPARVMPLLSFPNSGYTGSKGYLHLTPTQHEVSFKVDASGVPGATSTEVEISRANLLFEDQNSTHHSKNADRNLPAALTGQVLVNWNQLKSPGIYEVRAWAKDKSGRTLGVASDHIIIARDP